MPLLNIVFSSPINASCQVGDIVWKTVVSSQDSNNVFQQGQMGNISLLGSVVAIQNRDGLDPTVGYIGITIEGDIMPVISVGEFLIFSKDKKANTSGLKGYFAEAEFKNNSYKKAELFSVGANIEISSK
tara:strand:+ start:158 stop:544 length:387 start_codon:yes stop_codon:yes gene_type:complete